MSEFSTYQMRTPLVRQLPLDVPLSIHVCPTTYCNFKCCYCVHSLSTDKYLPNGIKKEFMTLDKFNILVNQIKKFSGKLKLLNFAYLGEPLLNKEITEMVKIAHDADIAERIEIVSNASMLNKKISKELVDAGLSRLRVSIQGLSDEEYYDMSKAKKCFKNIVENLRYMYLYAKKNGNTKIYIKTVDSIVQTSERKEHFFELFGDICDNLNIESLVPISEKCDIHNLKTEFTTGFFGNEIKQTNICCEVFYTMVVTPCGDVLPCCTMGTPPIKLGNIENSDIFSIWNSKVLKKFRIDMLKNGYKHFEQCKKCGVPMYQTSDADYLDRYVNELLKRYGENDA